MLTSASAFGGLNKASYKRVTKLTKLCTSFVSFVRFVSFVLALFNRPSALALALALDARDAHTCKVQVHHVHHLFWMHLLTNRLGSTY